ncbi:hypothetical protein BGW36DRAFT_387137 [Talaromyces proteolyticus]|uniref:HCP-like protein n=1 Tax=Talaromyces proteolyticus TaxID=1131652 RepID=A0AAD4PX26_9EURO|nr:uncharacterized protein BGW36DRAFT_387137 [Talaromyces proteolyticus]KAH8692174.1 hypothetical protein BGW36DRAFT_387137 [Talaromyces proteolyticus]
MPLRDLLHKRDTSDARPSQEFKFVRTDTHTQEILNPPSFDGSSQQVDDPSSLSPRRKSFFRRHSRSDSSHQHPHNPAEEKEKEKGERRISSFLHLDRSLARSNSTSSVNIPADLPQVQDDLAEQDREAQWEKRATRLVQGNPMLQDRPRSRSNSTVNEPQGDLNIQEAIRLHENGELEKSTKMFGILADPNGANNALGQVLYGLALRHGWGCEPNPTKAVTYLSAAASNSASIEAEALQAGVKKGGSAKGELVLAIFELANCFRNGWGIEKDPVAARQYYETAANLGDTDAMNEAAWCYLEGFGGKKDKFTAAKYYRLAEDHGNKTLGNSWIWKEKYNPK